MRLLFFFLLVNLACGAQLPRLVVVITVDGLPQEQVLKYRDQLTPGGFQRLLRDGAWFANAHHGHATTYTAVGHAAILTGAYPYRHGVVGNDWWDRTAQQRMYCCADPTSQLLDEPTKANAGTSPRNLQVTTVGDELRINTGMEAKVLSISLKDRGAIFTAGKTGLAYWFSKDTGRFITSIYYTNSYPAWWQEFYAGKPQDKWRAQSWTNLLPAAAYWRSAKDGCHVHEPGDSPSYDALRWSPVGDEYTLEFSLAALKGENLGKNPRGVPDLLALGLSCHDHINHRYGPTSTQSQDAVLQLDRTLETLFNALDQWVGLDHVLIALTADHGFANSPEFCRDVLRMETGRVDPVKLQADLNAALREKFGPGEYAVAWHNPTLTLAPAARRPEVEQASAQFLESQPGIHTVFTRTQLLNGQVPPTRFGVLAARSWHRQLSGDLFVIQHPGWYLFNTPDEHCVTHGSPWTYDTHVPLMLMGRQWIKPGQYNQSIEVVDLAPTLTTVLQVRPPSGAEGRVLHEILP